MILGLLHDKVGLFCNKRAVAVCKTQSPSGPFCDKKAGPIVTKSDHFTNYEFIFAKVMLSANFLTCALSMTITQSCKINANFLRDQFKLTFSYDNSSFLKYSGFLKKCEFLVQIEHKKL